MRIVKTLIAALALFVFSLPASAVHPEAEPGQRKVVIQVNSDDARTQAMAMNNAVNVQKTLGIDNVVVEIVAYGPGLSMLEADNKQSKRVSSLAGQEIRFSACGNTISKVEKKKGKKVVLSEGVKVVSAGVVRIMDLQEQGYSYVRP